MNRILILAFSIAIVVMNLVSCSDLSFMLYDENPEDIARCCDVTENDAVQIATSFMKEFDRTCRSSDSQSGEFSIDYIIADWGTRTGIVSLDTIAYIMNDYSTHSFVIVSARSSLPSILAFSKETNFDQDDEVVKTSFIEPLLAYSESVNIDSIDARTKNDWRYEVENVVIRTPVVKSELGQWSPFNKFIGLSHPDFPVGCVAVATAQLALHAGDTLANYHGRTVYLESLRKALVHWREIEDKNSMYAVLGYDHYYGPTYRKTEAFDSIASFLDLLSMDLNTSYKEIGGNKLSTAYSGNACTLLNKLGFKLLTQYIPFDLQDVIKLIDAECLIYIDGRDESQSVGHAFISDGYVKFTPAGRDKDIVALHIDWGWAGKNNGYFHGEVFKTTWGNYKPTKYFAIQGLSHKYLY